jgi:hypothetical protein
VPGDPRVSTMIFAVLIQLLSFILSSARVSYTNE